MRLKIDDGYTIKDETAPNWTDGIRQWPQLPVVAFEFRPALPEAIYDWQIRTGRAMNGKEQLDATAELLAAHLVTWDVIDKADSPVPIKPETVRRIPYPILQQLVARVTTWAPKNLEKSAGN